MIRVPMPFYSSVTVEFDYYLFGAYEKLGVLFNGAIILEDDYDSNDS